MAYDLKKSMIQDEQGKLDEAIIKIEETMDYYRSKKRSNDAAEVNVNEKNIKNAQNAMDNLYFKKLVYLEKGNSEGSIYVGKHGYVDLRDNIIITDWRAPISEVVFNYPGSHNKASYEVNGKRIEIIAIEKTDLTIENKIIVNLSSDRSSSRDTEIQSPSNADTIIDTEEFYIDEYLSEILKHSKDKNEFSDIIRSLQKDQYDIVNLNPSQSIIVQGSAGSGKSSVALHRISMILFRYHEKLRSSEICFIAPSKLFINFTKSVIPTLDLEGLSQETYSTWACNQLTNNKLVADKFLPQSETLEILLNIDEKKEYVTLQKVLKYIGSLDFKELVEKFVNQIMLNTEGIGKLEFHEWSFDIARFFEINKSMPFNGRVNKLEYELNQFKTSCLKSISEQLKFDLEATLKKWGQFSEKNESLRNELMRILEKSKIDIETTYRSEIDTKIKVIKQKAAKIDPLECLSRILSAEVLKLLNENIHEEELHALSKLAPIENKQIQHELIAPLLHIDRIVNGKKWNYPYLVIDEAQDLSMYQISLLEESTNSLMLLGDMNQSIYSYHSIDSWESVSNRQNHIVKDFNYKELKVSYRSTYQIIEYANKMIENSGLDLPQSIPFKRSGGSIDHISFTTRASQIEGITSEVKKFKEMGYKHVAIITKGLKEAVNLHRELATIKKDIVLCDQRLESLEHHIMVIPSYLSKGLEFDCCILSDTSIESYDRNNPIDVKLMYVAITRAQHQLSVFSKVIDSPRNKYLFDFTKKS